MEIGYGTGMSPMNNILISPKNIDHKEWYCTMNFFSWKVDKRLYILWREYKKSGSHKRKKEYIYEKGKFHKSVLVMENENLKPVTNIFMVSADFSI